MTNELWWYVARSCGIVAWVLLSASVLWGLLLSSKGFRRSVSPAWLLDLHRHLGGLGVVFIALHLLGLFQDRFVHFGATQLFVPLASQWRPGAVSWGIAGLYLMVAVELTSLARRKLSAKVWRWTHGLSFFVFVSATVHLFSAGTDARLSALRWSAITVCGVVGLAIALRVQSSRRARIRTRDRMETARQLAAAHRIPTATERFAPASSERLTAQTVVGSSTFAEGGDAAVR